MAQPPLARILRHPHRRVKPPLLEEGRPAAPSGNGDDLEHLLIDVRPAPLVHIGTVGGTRARDVENLAAVARGESVIAVSEIDDLPLLLTGARPAPLVDVGAVG